MMKGDVRHENVGKLSACVEDIDFLQRVYGSENEVFFCFCKILEVKCEKRPSTNFYARLHRFKALKIFQ